LLKTVAGRELLTVRFRRIGIMRWVLSGACAFRGARFSPIG
jgi:hypothetical protein